jgi:eukaryotic-like serine/threonine-protein kinase
MVSRPPIFEPSERADVLNAVLDSMIAGREVDMEELLEAHPEQALEILQLAAVVRFVQSAAGQLNPLDDIEAQLKVARDRPILGDYRILREVGRGGMGVVYEAEQISLQRRVALKVLMPGVSISARAVERFTREACTAGGLHHGNIVPVYAVGEHHGVPYYVMQFIDGRSLEEMMRERSPQQRRTQGWFRRVATWGRQIAHALEYAHRHGVTHRDIKPSNILIDSSDQAWITDFGLARRDANITITLSGDLVGTVRYMSPEQARGGQLTDERSDVYSLGVTLYELVSGLPAFGGDDRESTLRKVLLDEPVALRKLDRSIPPPLATIIHRAMEKEPHRRYPSAAVFSDDLHRFLEDRPIIARPTTALEQTRRLVVRHPFVTAGIMMMIVLTAGTLAFVSRAAIVQTAAAQAEREQREVSDALLSFMTATLQAASPMENPGGELTVRAWLDRAAEQIGKEFRGKPIVAAAMHHTLGQAYFDLGLYAQAEFHLIEAHQARHDMLGDDHADTLLAAMLLSSALYQQGRVDDALALTEHSFKHVNVRHGADDVFTLRLMNLHGNLLADRGDLERGRDMLVTVLEQLAASPVSGLDRVTVLGNLAGVQRRLGEFDAALANYHEVLATRMEHMGERHLSTLSALHNLGLALLDVNEVVEAIEVLERALGLRMEVLGPDHDSTLATMNTLGMALSRSGRNAEAIELLEHVVEYRIRTYGENNPAVARSMNNLARSLQRENRFYEALELMERATAILMNTRGADHHETLVLRSHMGRMKLVGGHVEEAGEIAFEVMQSATRTFPAGHWQIARYEALYAEALMHQGRYDEAAPLLRAAHEALVRDLGEDHRWTHGIAGLLDRLDLEREQFIDRSGP